MSSERADQFACTRRVLEVTPDAVAVSNLGVASYVLAGVADRDRNCYLWGSMGVTTPVGLGLALAVDDPVAVLDGDGSLLMGLGALSTVAAQDPPNLTIVCFENGQYATTGGQPVQGVDFAGVARACDLPARRVEDADAFEAAYREATERDAASVVVCAVEPVDPETRPPRSYDRIAHRVRDALAPD